LGITPLYTTFTEIYRALERIRVIVEEKIYEQYSDEQLKVT
jgi:kynureninase